MTCWTLGANLFSGRRPEEWESEHYLSIYLSLYIYIYRERERYISSAKTPKGRQTWMSKSPSLPLKLLLETAATQDHLLPHNLPTNIIPTKIAWLRFSGKSPMGLGIPPLKFKIMLESNPLKSIMLVRKSAVPPRLDTLAFQSAGGFDPSRILNSRGGILMSRGNFPEDLSRRTLAGTIVVES